MSHPRPFAPGVHTLAGLTLRPLLDGELAPLAATLAAMDPWKTLGYSPAGLERYLRRDDAALHRFAVVEDGRVGGVVALRHPWLRGSFIELLALLEHLQGRGAATRIVEWVVDEASRDGGNVWVTASAFNTGALAFYAGRGFETIGTLPDLIATGHDETLLRRRPKPATAGDQ